MREKISSFGSMSLARRWLSHAGLALVLGLSVPAAGQAAATVSAAYVVLGPGGAVARAIVSDASACPTMTVDGASLAMSIRAAPDPSNFPVLVCEAMLPASARSASVAGRPLAVPPTTLSRIVVIGDTGCRLKGKASAGGDTDDEEDKGKFQACNDTTAWPFSPISKAASRAKPDVTIHVGDYLYRESPCDPGDQGCAKSPHGDNWATWQADFFAPAAPLLAVAPWIAARGNHEICARAGNGYLRFLDPRPAVNQAPPACTAIFDPYTVTVAGQSFIVMDSSNAPDADPTPAQVAPYAAQFSAMRAPEGSWLVTHRPIWGFATEKTKDADGRVLFVRNQTLQKALAFNKGLPPAGIALMLSGHIHLWEALSFSDRRAPQFILGSGGTLLAHDVKKKLRDDVSIGGASVKSDVERAWGFTVFRRKYGAGAWEASLFDPTGKTVVTCPIDDGKVKCQ